MDNRVVVITGASAGIGAGVAELVGARGGRPVLCARRAPELAEVAARSGPAALAITADVTVRADVERVMAAAVERFGQVDVWINNAGRGISRPVLDLTDEDIDDMVRVNVKSALYGMQVAVAHFKQRGRGHLINVSSLLGRVPMAAVRSAYSASKHFLNSLTVNLRVDLAAEYPDIHVSTVSPGVVATDFGLKARHGGMDSRRFPGAQSVEEVAGVICDLIERPRADVYTREGMREIVAAYYAAADMAAAETSFFPSRPPGAR